MTCMSKFLLPIRRTISATASSGSSISIFRHQFNRNFRNLKKCVDIIEPIILNHSSNLGNLRRKYATDFCFSGPRIFGSCLAASFFCGYVSSCAHFSYNMVDGEGDTKDSDTKDDERGPLMFVKKYWVAIIYIIFVLFAGLYNPFTIPGYAVLFLMSTNPDSSSIHLFVHTVQQHLIREQPLWYRFKSIYARKVEVEDFVLFHMAIVEIGHQKLTLLGILDGWWVLPPPSILRLFREWWSGLAERSQVSSLCRTAFATVDNSC